MIKIKQIKYNIKRKDKLSRTGTILLKNGKKIETPMKWFGLSIAESFDFQKNAFEEAGVTNFLSNAYDLKYRDKKDIRKKLIHKFTQMGLFHKMDSGGFQLMKQDLKNKQILDLNPKIVYEIQRKFSCDIAVTLDVPLGVEIKKSSNKKKIDKTIENLEDLIVMYDKNSVEFSILPVIHGHNREMLEYAINRLTDVLGEEPEAIGIGSLVPLLKSIKDSSKVGGKKNFIKILLYLRKKLPNAFIHAFGVGGTMSYLAYLCGVDSIDSNGWILKASMGVIQLPGISDRFLREKPHGRPYLIENRKYKGIKKTINEIDIFMNCKCPVCSQYRKNGSWTMEDRRRKILEFDQYTENSRKKRVIHNLWLYQNEVKLIREAINKDNLINFITKRLEHSNYRKYVKIILKNIKTNQKKLDEF